MKKILLMLALLAPMATAQRTLSTLVGRNRVLLIFTPTELDTRFNRQLEAFNHHEAELMSRDLVLIPLVQQPGPANLSPVLRNMRPPLVQADEQITFRKRFHISPNDFVMILIGKDGTEKLRSSTTITAARLNKTIDAMPGRQDEMRQRQ
jgi:hypothetical protein